MTIESACRQSDVATRNDGAAGFWQHDKRSTIRALHVVPSLESGGATRGAMEIVRGLSAREGFDARLCVLGRPASHPLLETLPQPPMCLEQPVHESGHGLSRVRRLRAVIRSVQPDLVHAHLWPAARVAAQAMVGLRSRLIVHIRDTPPAFAERRWQSRLKTLLLRASLRTAHPEFIAVSAAARDFTVRTLGIDSRHCTVILNGIDITPFAAVPSSRVTAGQPVVIGTAGRLVAAKGHSVLIDAVRQLRQGGTDVRLRVAGSGGLRDALIAQVRSASLQDAVEFVGEVTDMAAFYGSIDLFALPSLHSEGLPRVLLEAMASSRAAVASDAEGVNEVIAAGVTGELVPPGDAAALAGAIGRLCADRPALSHMGRCAREAVIQRCHTDRVVDDVARYYVDLLSGARGCTSA